MLCAKYHLQSERTFETPCIADRFNEGLFPHWEFALRAIACQSSKSLP